MRNLYKGFKMRTPALIAMLLIVPLLGQAPSDPQINAGRIAQMVGPQEVTFTWKASSHDLTLVPSMSVFPTGMTAVIDGNDIVLTLLTNTVGLFDATITVTAQIPVPIANWTGPPITINAQQTANFQWIVYDKNAVSFLNGFGDVLLP